MAAPAGERLTLGQSSSTASVAPARCGEVPQAAGGLEGGIGVEVSAA